MIDNPHIVETVNVQVAFIPITVAREQIREVMGPGISEVLAIIVNQGLVPAGPWFTHHLRIDPAVSDFRICVPVASPIMPQGRVQPGQLAAASVVRTIYHGPYDGLGAAWGVFNAWIAAAGHSSRPDLWECYVAGPETSPDPDAWLTELNRPLIGQVNSRRMFPASGRSTFSKEIENG